MRSFTSSLIWLLLAAVSCESNSGSNMPIDAAAEASTREVNGARQAWRPLDPDQPYRGKSLSEWAIEWMRWAFSQDSCDSSTFDPDGSQCRLYQDDPELPVFHMAYAPSEHPRTLCTVPRGRAIIVPLANFWFDNIGQSDPKTAAELEQDAAQALESIRDLQLRVDGETISDLERFIVQPTQFSYRVPPAPNWYSCNGTEDVGDITVEPAVLTGYYAVLPPPELGPHEIEYGGALTYEGEDYALMMVNQFEVVDE
jgi:hypothetical protein